MSDPTSTTLLFVYNADSGLFNTLTDIAHKVFSPKTYACNLCAITHSATGMREEWKGFLEELGRPMEFLHRDEFHKKYGEEGIGLPAILERDGEEWRVRADAAAINGCETMEDLQELIRGLGW